MSESIHVAWITIPEGAKRRYDISETASRFEEVALEPGTYEVHAERDYHDRGECRLFAMVPSTVTSRYDGAEFCGVAIGNSPQFDSHPMVGEPRDTRVPVMPGQVDGWEPIAPEVLAWKWYTHVWNTNGRLEVRTNRTMRWTDRIVRAKFRLTSPVDLPEFFTDEYAFATRANALLDKGFVPETFRVSSYGDNGEITAIYPDRYTLRTDVSV